MSCGSKLAGLTLIRPCKPRAGGGYRIGDKMVTSRPIDDFGGGFEFEPWSHGEDAVMLVVPGTRMGKPLEVGVNWGIQ